MATLRQQKQKREAFMADIDYSPIGIRAKQMAVETREKENGEGNNEQAKEHTRPQGGEA